MRQNFTLLNLLVVGIASLVVYAIIDGIRSESTMGVAMGLCSLVAFIYTIRLARKLAKLKKEEEQELL